MGRLFVLLATDGAFRNVVVMILAVVDSRAGADGLVETKTSCMSYRCIIQSNPKQTKEAGLSDDAHTFFPTPSRSTMHRIPSGPTSDRAPKPDRTRMPRVQYASVNSTIALLARMISESPFLLTTSAAVQCVVHHHAA